MIEILGQIGIIIIILTIISALFISLAKISKDNLKQLGSFIFLLSIIFVNMFIYNPIINILSFLFMILDLLYLIYKYLPYFKSNKDQDLFFEVKDEIWNDLKLNRTILTES